MQFTHPPFQRQAAAFLGSFASTGFVLFFTALTFL